MRASSAAWSTATRAARSGSSLLEHRLDGGVLVLGVVDQEGDDVAHVARRGRRGRARRLGSRLAALGGHGEQLGADGLVDVSVQVEGHRARVVAG